MCTCSVCDVSDVSCAVCVCVFDSCLLHSDTVVWVLMFHHVYFLLRGLIRLIVSLFNTFKVTVEFPLENILTDF